MNVYGLAKGIDLKNDPLHHSKQVPLLNILIIYGNKETDWYP